MKKYIFLVITFLFLVFAFRHVFYSSVSSILATILTLIALGLLFYEIIKKYGNFQKRKIILSIVLLAIWILSVMSQIEYIPQQNLRVVDVFDQPLKGMSVTTRDEVGCVGLVDSCGPVYRDADQSYITNNNGEIQTEKRIYFGQKKAINIRAYVNRHEKLNEYSPKDVFLLNRDNDTRYKKKILKNETIIISPWSVELEDCNQTECKDFSIFYSAVKDNDSSICKKYQILPDVDFNSFGNAHYPLMHECLIFVEGVLNKNPNICKGYGNSALPNYSDTNELKRQCDSLFVDIETDPEYYCGYNDVNRCKLNRQRLLDNPKDFICSHAYNAWGIVTGTLVPAGVTSSWYYAMFCQ